MKDKIDEAVEQLVEGPTSQYERAVFEIDALVKMTQEIKRVMGFYSEDEAWNTSMYFKEIADMALNSSRNLSRALIQLQQRS